MDIHRSESPHQHLMAGAAALQKMDVKPKSYSTNIYLGVYYHLEIRWLCLPVINGDLL